VFLVICKYCSSPGQILNRFSKDMGAVDEILPFTMMDCIEVRKSLVIHQEISFLILCG
jgi:hypothetical protein